MKIGQPLTPAMLRLRDSESRPRPLPPASRDQLPELGSEPDEDSTVEWLAHIAAGRIPVPSDVEGDGK